MTNMEPDAVKKDTKYSWIVCIATMGISFLIFGSLRSSGVMFVALKDFYGTQRSQSAIIASATFGSMFATSAMIGAIVHRFGYRRPFIVGSVLSFSGSFASYFITEGRYLVFTIGILEGIGFGFMYVPKVAIIGHYFQQYLGLATGLSMAGSSLGSMAVPPMMEYLIEQFGLRGTFLVYSGVLLNFLVFSMMIFDPIPRNHSRKVPLKSVGIDNMAMEISEDHVKNSTEVVLSRIITPKHDSNGKNFDKTIGHEGSFWKKMSHLLKNRYTYGVIFMHMASQAGVAGFALSIPDFAVSGGTSLLEATYLISIAFSIDIATRILIGVLLDRQLISLSFSYAIVAFGCGFALTFIGMFGGHSYVVLASLSCIFGLFYGGNLLHVSMNATRYLGKENTHLVLSLSSVLSSLATFSVGPIMTEMFKTFGNYSEFYYFLGCLLILSALYWLALGISERASRI